MDENTLKGLVSKNIAVFRKLANLTQLELSEKLNYSDKAVSKWERGEALPDIVVLKQMAELFHVRLDDFFSTSSKKRIYIGISIEKRILLPIMAIVFAFFVATVIFTFMVILSARINNKWLAFIYALPAAATSTCIFSAVWKHKFFVMLSLSIFCWTLALALFLSLPALPYRALFFVVSAPAQLLVAAWYTLNKITDYRKRKRLLA